MLVYPFRVIDITDTVIDVLSGVVVCRLEGSMTEFLLPLGVRELYALAVCDPAQSRGVSRNSRNYVRREFPCKGHRAAQAFCENLCSRELGRFAQVRTQWAVGVFHREPL